MDIWGWVDKLTDELEESGQDRIAGLFYRLPGHIVDQEIEQAESLLPEALAAAKAMDNPWAEVFFRHWEMRLRLGLNGEGESALPEVVDLLDFAHSEQCAACPQTMCTTQDIASCYSNIDAPGWADECRAVAMEGIGKIDPGWNCFGCLYHQYIWALHAEKRYEEGLAACDEYERRMLEWGTELDAQDLIIRADLLIGLDQYEQALAILDKAAAHPDMENDARRRTNQLLSRTAALIGLGRMEEAWDTLPPWDEITPGDYEEWLGVAGAIAMALPEHNQWGLGACFQKALEHCCRVGAHRSVINIGEKGVRLSILRGAYITPRRILEMMRRHLPKLRRPCGADTLMAELEHTVGSLYPPKLPVTAPELLEHLKTTDHPNAEQGIDWLYAALEQLPDDMGLLLTACSALAAMNAVDEAQGLLRDFIHRNPETCEDAVDNLIRYTPHHRTEELHALADQIEPRLPSMATWVRLHIAFRAMDLSAVAEEAQRYIASRPDALGARMIWAATAQNAKEFKEATRLRQEIVRIAQAQEDENCNNHRWDLLVSATCAENWKLVRETCIAMEFDVEPGDTPIDDPGQYIRIRYQEEGRWHTAVAQRNGPVTGRIVSGSWPGKTQRTRDLVVFDPELLEPYPEDEEERKYFHPPYRLEHTLEKGNFRNWLVDGFYPGREEFERLRETLETHGFSVDICCDAEYTIADPNWEGGGGTPQAAASDEDEPFPPPGRLDGIYFLLAAPTDFSPVELDAILSRETKHWEHPLCWLALAEAAGKPVEKHQAIIERYGL